jgi:hypothetical protein
MMVSDQPVITVLDQNHAKSSPRFSHLAVSSRAEFIEPGCVGDVVVEHDSFPELRERLEIILFSSLFGSI